MSVVVSGWRGRDRHDVLVGGSALYRDVSLAVAREPVAAAAQVMEKLLLEMQG